MKMGMIIGDVSPTESVEQAVLAEKLGFESVWFSDHLIDAGGISIDPYTTMGAIAARTSRLKMCAAVSDTQRVHPAKLAHMVATLSDISRGRVWLGIGAGEAMNVVPFGMPFEEPKARTQRLAEAIQVIKLLWRSSGKSPVSFQGDYFSLTNAWFDLELKETPRVYVGALGARPALEVAGRYGDGWVSWLNTPETFKRKLEIARAASPSPRDFEACVWVYTVLSDEKADVQMAVNRAKRGLLAETSTLRMLGFERPKEIGKSFQNMLVTEEAVARIAKMQGAVPDELAASFIAAGNPSHVVERLEQFSKAGATRAMIHFVKQGGGDQMERFAEDVLPYLRSP